jgi:serine/threonine-protein kinase HipA
MTGDKHALDLYLGKDTLIGKLILSHDDQLFWQYNERWQQTGFAISPHLPINNDIPPVNVHRFLRNLLPEGNGLDELVAHFHQLSKNNTFGLMLALGLDAPGALSMLAVGKIYPTEGKFLAISDSDLEERLNAREESGLIVWHGKPRLSVAGVQDKINVVVNEKDQLGFGEGSLCSTHILKFEKKKLSHLVLNEYITLQLAKQCGLNVTDATLMRFGKNPALLIKRFDRRYISINEVMRRPVFDGCQALNLSPEYKYERNFGSSRDVAHIRDGASFQKLFSFANQCANPALTKQQMLDWALFNLMVFNYDAHGKNITFFVNEQGLSLAPFYDLVNVKMYPDFEQEMAMALGDEFDSNNINAYQLADFAETCQLSRAIVAKRLKLIANKLILGLQKEMSQIIGDSEEVHYMQKYQLMVAERCDHLLSQADEILSIKL